MIETLLSNFQAAPAELTSLSMLVVSGAACLMLFRSFGLYGLYSFISIAVVAANIQVLKAAQFSFFSEPVALGTIVFASTYMAINIITEHYGRAAAQRGIWISFSSMFLMTAMMVLTLGWAPLGGEGEFARFDQAHGAIETLFLPAPTIFISSFIAYVVSQYNDIWIFQAIRKLTSGRMLWMRSNGAMLVSALVDSTIFSLLAWWVLSPDPLSLNTIIYTYILGTYILRIVLSFVNTPFVYLSYYFRPDEESDLIHA